MKKKQCLRIQAFTLVLLVMLTTFAVNPRQVQADTTVDAEDKATLGVDIDQEIEESQITAEQELTLDINSTESPSDQEQVDVETENAGILPESDNEVSSENNPVSIEGLSDLAVASEEITDEKTSELAVESTTEDIDSSIKSTEPEHMTEDAFSENSHLQNPNFVSRNIAEEGISTRAANPESDFEYVEENGTITITGYTGESKDVEIPEKIDGKPVTVIGWKAFADNQLTGVTIPDSVTEIRWGAFAENQLTSVTIPDSVTTIEGYAFYKNQLTDVTIPDSVTEIGGGAFQYNRLASVTIPDSLTAIYPYVFCNNQLTSVTIPDSVTEIALGAFQNNQLTDVTIPDSVTEIRWSAFQNNQLTDVTIPDSVTEIGRSAFAYNQLTSVTISDSVTKIGVGAFYENQLTSVTIPDSVTEIGSGAFENNQLTSVTIPDSVTEIEWAVFGNNQLTSVIIPDSVTEIGRGAFYENQLTSVTIPDSVTKIGGGAFYGNQLTGVTIPDSVTSIGEGAFQENLIKEVTIPNSIKEITTKGEGAQPGTIIFNPTVAQVLEHCFDPGVIAEIDCYVKAGSNIRNAPGGTVIENFKMPIYVTGTTEGNYLKFTYKGQTAYAHLGVTTTNPPPITGYAKGSVNVRNAPSTGAVIGSLSIGHKVNGTLEGNWVKLTYSGKTGYVYVSMLQANPVKVTRYIKAGSNIRKTPTGTVIENLKMPIYITGTIEGNYLEFTYKGQTAYAHLGVTTTKSPPITGYAKSSANVRSSNGSKIGLLSIGSKVSGTLVGNRVKFTYSGKTGYVYVSMLQANPVKVTRYIKAGSNIRKTPTGTVIENFKMPIYVTGTIEGNYLKFTYKGQTAYAHLGVTTTNPPPITGYAKSSANVRSSNGSKIGSLSVGSKVSGTLVGNRVKFTYSGKTGYVYVSMLQANPVKVTRYIKTGSKIRSTPGGTLITTLKTEIRVTGTIQGTWFKFTYNGRTSYVVMSNTTILPTTAPYIGNKNTGKFHHSNCRYANEMNPNNKEYFFDRNTAVNQGYIPCKICNP
ncbi:MAG: leucine-rich repeat protein [Saccharofermentanales bacterium]